MRESNFSDRIFSMILKHTGRYRVSTSAGLFIYFEKVSDQYVLYNWKNPIKFIFYFALFYQAWIFGPVIAVL